MAQAKGRQSCCTTSVWLSGSLHNIDVKICTHMYLGAELAPVTFGVPNAAFPVMLFILAGVLVRGLLTSLYQLHQCDLLGSGS